MITRETQTVIEFSNGSEIHSLPANEDGSNIRGFTAHFIIIDEAGYIDDRVYKAIRPMLATTQGHLWLIGTPNGVGNYFYRAFTVKSEQFVRHHFKSEISPKIDERFLDQERESMPDQEYRQEYEAEFIDEAGVMFPLKQIDSLIDDNCPIKEEPTPGLSYVLGYDPAAFGSDDAVGIILEDRRTHKSYDKSKPFAVVNTFEFKRVGLEYQLNYIKNLHNIWKFKRLIVDTTGLGTGLLEFLLKESIPVEEFIFSLKSKQEVYFYTKRVFDANELILPRHAKLRKQLSEMKTEKSVTGYTKIYHPAKTGQDDYPTALVLAIWGTRMPNAPMLFAGAGRKLF